MKSVLRVLPVAIAASAATVLLTASSAFASSPTQVPEPVSVTLIGIGIAGLVGKMWMDRKREK